MAAVAQTRGREDLLAVAPKAQTATPSAATARQPSAEPVTIEGAGSSGGTEANGRRKRPHLRRVR